MRYLNKIAFINSAQVPYAEVQLDGNIHFIGTQGVGKSTLLRAILFFYNADALRLGMPKGPTAKSFAEWYLNYNNSYIIYEVQRETGAYCVLAYATGKHVSFRFLDTVYDRQFFINDDGKALNGWEQVRQRLDEKRINVSNKIDRYSEYRDILYGNYIGKNEYKKYALLEAKQYHNIYKTIQNVFLNTKLDAAEIKYTIISSMEDEKIEIDLDKHNKHLNDFEDKLSDIRNFRKPIVQKQANDIIDASSIIRHLKREQRELIAKLNWRIKQIEVEKPLLADKEKQLKEAQDVFDAKKEKETQLFSSRIERINKTLTELNAELKKAKKQRKYYDNLNIESIIERVSKKQSLEIEKSQLEKELQLLTNEYAEITNKYAALIKELEQNQETLAMHSKSEQLELEMKYIEFKEQLNQEYEEIMTSIAQEFEITTKKQREEIEHFNKEKVNAEKQKITIKHTNYYAAELAQLKDKLGEISLEIKTEDLKAKSYREKIEAIQEKWDFEKSKKELDIRVRKEKLQQEISELKARKQELENIIENSQDSLYAWLNKNYAGWENSIGKVVGEDLLFNTNLKPALVESKDSFYGVALDLEVLEFKSNTLEDYKFELEKCEKAILEKQRNNQGLDADLEAEQQKIQNRYQPKIRTLKEQGRDAKARIERLEKQAQQVRVDLDDYEQKAIGEKAFALDTIQNKIDELAAKCNELSNQLNQQKAIAEKQRSNKQREKSRRINEQTKQKAEAYALLSAQLEKKKAVLDIKIKAYKQEQLQSLENVGANTERITQLQESQAKLKIELSYIDEKRSLVAEYEKDKRELFDNEKRIKAEVERFEEKTIQVKQDYANVCHTLEKEASRLNSEKASLEEAIRQLSLDEKELESFLKLEIAEEIFKIQDDSEELESTERAVELIHQLERRQIEINNKLNDIKSLIDRFLSHFSVGNDFNFPAKLQDDEAYLEWSLDLCDFIEEDKISAFEKRTSETFTYIINTIGKETTMLISKTGEIKKIINKVNNDFKRSNFVQSVTSIELNIKDSKNTTVMLLNQIKTFNDESAFSLGNNNLFASSDIEQNNQKAITLLRQLVTEIKRAKSPIIHLADSFELEFRVEENGNDTGWVEKLSNVGSEGTDVLVKAMVNIMLLNVFKESASRKFKDFKLHCMMDEIGKLHNNNITGILSFANERNINLINGSPMENTPLKYRHIYLIEKDNKKQTRVKRIVSNPLN